MAYITKKTTTNGTKPIGSNLFGTCSTGASTAGKVVSLPAFDALVEGVTIHVYFVNGNEASNPTLKVGSASAVAIKCMGADEGKWDAGAVVSFTYYNGSWHQNDYQQGGGGDSHG